MEVSKINGYDIKDKKAKRFYNNVQSMKNDSLLKSGMFVETKGYYEANDGGEASYTIREKSSNDIEDSGKIHFIINDLVAELTNTDSVNVRQFGAKGDYETDDTEAFQNALNCSKDVYVPSGIFMIRSIYLNERQTLHGDYPSSRLQCIDSNRNEGDYMIYVNSNSQFVNISGFYFGGNGRLTQTRVGCIRVIGGESWNVPSGRSTISHCYFTSFSGSAIYLDEYVNNYFISDLIIISMRSGIVINSTDCNISSSTIGGIDEEGLYLGGDNFVSGVKCWLCGKNSDENNKYYALHMVSNNTVIGYYGQQNIYDDIRIDGDGNKIEFTSNMDGDRKTLSDIAVISIGEEANYNQIKGVVTQGKSNAYFDYILKFEGEKNQVGNNFELVVYNMHQSYDITVKNGDVHDSNVIKIDNRDYSCKVQNLIESATTLSINYNNLSDVTTITQNSNGEFAYTYPISLSDMVNGKGCYMVYKMNNFDFTNKTKVFVSFDVDSNVETSHKQEWRCFGVKPITYASVNCSSKFKTMKNKWHFDGVIEIPEEGLNSIRIGLFLYENPDSQYNYPQNTDITISNLSIKVI